MPPRARKTTSPAPKSRSRSKSATPAARKKAPKMPSSSEVYREVFESIDVNKDGVIDLLELSNAVSGKYDFTPFRVQQLMQEADLDGDGKIDLDEFCRVMEAHRESVDLWGMASKSIWTKFWSAAQETHEVTESMFAPMRKLSREHSVPIDVGKERYRKPSAGFRIVAHCLNPLALIATVFPSFVLFGLCLIVGNHFERGKSFEIVPIHGMNQQMAQFFMVLVMLFGTIMAIYLLFKPMSRGQTPSHYMFGLQMVDSDGKHVGFVTIITKFFLFILLNAVTLGCMELIDGTCLILSGRTVLDALLGVTVVIRDDKKVE